MNKTRAHRGRKENPIDEYVFLCSTYKSYGRERCGSHAIEARDVYDTLLKDILRLAKEAIDDDREMVKRILDRMGADREKQSGLIADELKEKRSRLSEIDMLFKKLYEDKVNGVISDRNFQMMNGKYEEEQNGLQKRIDEMKALMAEEDSRTENAGQFVKLIREYAKISSLDAALITTLIEKVIIGKSIEADGKTTRDIKIYYKHVGNIS